MTTRCNVAIELDERGFWHVNAFLIHDDPMDDGDVPDAHSTTKKGASLDDAIALARKRYSPTTITIWEPCPECGGTGYVGDYDHEIELCDMCEDGKQPRVLPAQETGEGKSSPSSPLAAAGKSREGQS